MAREPNAAARLRGRLQAEALLLARRYGEVDFDRQDGTWLHVKKVPLPKGWNKPSVEILIDIPTGSPGYPEVAPEWFWTDRDLRTRKGRSIQHFFTAASGIASRNYVDSGWGHFCIHLRTWKPKSGARMAEGHTLVSYLDLISTVFADRKHLAE